ncbi:MAG: acetyl-CoA carboxylase carboxyl transferase subunit alpha, partial [Verrucomicrobiota bacterium]|nr:acetyl-CoA carboxylase carboxyl transferase subunit alpha [Verrucomicrobiota bacterium]
GAHRDFDLAAKALKGAIIDSLAKLKKKSIKKLLEDRYTKFRHLGEFAETEASTKAKVPRSHDLA